MKIPQFRAETALRTSLADHNARTLGLSASDVIVPAQGFRVTCPGTPVLGATCTILGGAAGFFPCFGNTTCMWFHAGLAFPACFGCSHN